MTLEPNIKHKLHRPESDYNHFLEIHKTEEGIKAVKKDTKPIFNEDTYKYEINEEGEMIFKEGRHSCSGAGKYRATTPSEKLEAKIVELSVPLIDAVVSRKNVKVKH